MDHPPSAGARPARHPFSPGGPLGIDEALIGRVVDAFYARIRADSLLGPVFAARIEDARWPLHLAKMRDFWSSVLLTTGRYKGQPMPAHLSLPIDESDFRHWLALFQASVEAECPGPMADLFMDRATRIASSMNLAIATQRGLSSPENGLARPFEWRSA